MGRIRRAEREDPDHKHYGEQEKGGHGNLRKHFDASRDAAVDHREVYQDRDAEEYIRCSVPSFSLVVAEERGHPFSCCDA